LRAARRFLSGLDKLHRPLIIHVDLPSFNLFTWPGDCIMHSV